MVYDKEVRTVRKEDDSELFEQLEALMFTGVTETEMDGQRYNIARDEKGKESYVLSPVD
jgi:hypothetical protein